MKPVNNTLRGLLSIFLLSFLNLSVLPEGQSQSCPNNAFPAAQTDLSLCTPAIANCVTPEVEILSIYLEADPLLCVPCLTGDVLSANVYAQLNNLSENNSAIGVFGDLFDGTNTCDFIKCNGPLLAQSATPAGTGLQDLFLGSISWVCGQALTLQNISVVVAAPGNLCPLSCADTPASCTFAIPNLSLTMPVVSIIPDPGCDDGDCTNGVETWDGCECVAGTPPVDPGCDDGICANGLEIWDGCDCQPGTPPVDPGCDDGDCTNGIETWDGCMCQPGTPPEDPGCDDGICANGIETWDGCNCVTGTAPTDCVTTIAQSCNDNNPCTVNDTELVDACSGIVCVPCTGSGTMDCTIFTLLACDDMNPCTVNDQYQLDACSGDVCVPCEGTPVASCQVLVNQACDDLNPCTTNDIESLDACSGEICVPCAGIPVAPPTCDPNCEVYNPVTCGCDPILAMDCDDNNCATIDNYNPITCSCENIPIDDSACNDGLCYTNDYLDPITCLCVNEPITDVDCDDNNCATEDFFNYDTCECEHVAVCNNVTNAGWIGYDQGNCSAFDPSPLVSLEPATGGCGAIEYMWLKSNVNVPYYGDNNGPWTIIPNENGIAYDPPFMASGVMCFLRCARTNTCTDFIGESNIVCITVGTTEVCNDWDCTTEDIFNTTTCECEYTVITTPNCDDNDCSTYDYFDAENCECVHEVTCDNVTYGGLISGNQESCSAFDPEPITSLTEPSGGCGGLEYLWIASTHNVFSGSSTGSPWYTVIGANGPTYDPGVLTQTTYFRRCARRTGCTSWIGESNIICIEVGSAEVCDDGNCATLDAYDPDTCQCTHTPIDINCDDNDCSTEDLYDPLTCLCTHVVIPPPDCNDNDCTTEEFYDAANCQCVYTIVELPDCNDNNCSTQDIFNQTTCECEYITLPPVDCNDNDCNTIDSYNASTCSCENTPIDINTCDDNDCSTADSYDPMTCECINVPIQTPDECVIAPPATITLDACSSSIDPAVIGGAPTIGTCVCVNFTIEYTDVNVGLPNTDCLSTIRTWTVVSDCGCEDVSLSFTQEIIQFNQIGPSITVPADLTVSASNDGCTREVSLLAVATAGECSFGPNATIDPSEITNSFTNGGADAFAAYPLGTTAVSFTVEDDCGGTASGVTNVTVIDDIAPICVAQDVTLSLDVNGEAVVNAAQVDNGSSDACGTVSLAIDPVVTYTCSDVGQDLSVNLIVTDELGNSSTCSASITIIDQTPMGCVTAPPLSLTLDACVNDVDPLVIGGAPSIAANCDAADFNISFTDVNVTLPNADCIGIERTWTVVSNAGCNNVNLSYVQEIILLNQIGPSISVPADVTVSASDAGCTNSLTLVAVATAGECSSGPNAIIDASEVTNSFNAGGADASGNYPVGLTAVTFVVTDDCGRTASGVTNVTVVDDVPPICVAQDVTLFLDSNGEVELNIADVDNGSSDACGPVSLVVTPVTTYTCADVGQALSVDLIVTDASGNTSTCASTITVIDMTQPMCFDNITIDLGSDGTYIIDPNELIDGAVGACSGSITLSTDVMNLGCNNLGTEVCVILTVTDQNGSSSTCKSIFNVEVAIPSIPAGICPADVTVDCNTDVSDLSIFGSPDLTAPQDYCFHRFTAEEMDLEDLDACGVGTITRTWTFLDPNGDLVLDVSGAVLSCSQTITLELGNNALTQSDITCPADVTINCDETVNDQPVIDLSNVTCSDVVITSNDVINNQNGLCDYTIERTFTITDQCQVAPAGIFTCVQIITVLDNTAPVISNLPADVTLDLINEANTCSTVLEYAINIVDDCSTSGEISYTIDAPGLISAGTLDAAGNVNPMIEWCTSDSITVVYVTATDACANVAIDSFEVVVIGEPCVTFFCEKFPFNLEDDGDIEIDSDTWIPLVVTNDCNHIEVDIAYSTDITDTLMTYGCDDITVMNMGNISDSIFFFIDGVLVDSCRVVVFFANDWETICNNNFTTGQIRGRVRNPEMEPVEDVDMQLEGSQFVGIYTDENGRYAFPNMSLGGTYDVIPAKDEDHRNGVTTLDIVLTQRHILGLQDFESPYQHIAADVNKSNNVTAADLIQMRKLILGVYEEFPDNTSWRIVDDAYTFPDPTDPLAVKFNESHYIFGFEEDLNVDFTAVKIGDINYSATSSSIANNSEARSNRVLMLNYQDRGFVRDEVVKVEFSMDEYETLDGFQFALSINPDLLQIEEVITSDETLMGGQNYSDLQLEYGMLPVSWNRTRNDMPKGKLFSLRLKAVGDGNLNSAIAFEKDKMSPEAYFNQEVAEISMAHNSMAIESKEFVITGLYPVPFRSLINFEMIAPRNAELSVEVFANTGERIRTESKLELKPGANSYQWDMGTLPEGHYIFRFTVNDEVFVRKMIKLD